MGSSLRPSSLLAVINMTASFASAALMPLLGAVIDRTPHRRTFTVGAVYALIVVNALQVRVSGGAGRGRKPRSQLALLSTP